MRRIFGLHPVEEAVRRGGVQAVFVVEGDAERMKALIKACGERRIPVEEKPKAELTALAETDRHQGVVALSGEYAYSSLDAILESAAASARPPLVLVLDSIQDPGNLGALIRSAHIFGVDGILIPRDRAARVTPTVVKASAGASEHVKIALEVNLVRSLEQLKEAGYWIAGTMVDGGVEPWRCDLKVPLALVLGAEGKGIRPLVAKHCDLRVKIPMLGQVVSLNVSVAGGVLLYEIARQRA